MGLSEITDQILESVRKYMDMRVVKTCRAIRSALIDLSREKSVDEITVKELCERAEVSKQAFYSHYRNIYDVVDEIEDEAVQNLVDGLLRVDIDDISSPALLRELGKRVFHSPLRNVVFPDRGSALLVKKFAAAYSQQSQTVSLCEKRNLLAIIFSFDGILSIMQRMGYERYMESVDDLSVIMHAAITAFDE